MVIDWARTKKFMSLRGAKSKEGFHFPSHYIAFFCSILITRNTSESFFIADKSIYHRRRYTQFNAFSLRFFMTYMNTCDALFPL
jgi:hypothetical protein